MAGDALICIDLVHIPKVGHGGSPETKTTKQLSKSKVNR
jgi:hypothetical protein